MTSKKGLTITSILVALFLYFSIIKGLWGLNKHIGLSKENALLTSRIEFWTAILLIFLFTRKVEKTNFLLWTEQKKKPLFYLISVIAILGGITILLNVLSLLQNKFGTVANDKVINSLTGILCNNLGLLIFTCLTAAFTEELFFRGFLIPRFQLLLNKSWISIILSAVLFGLSHFGYGDMQRMVFPFIIGIVFGFFYSKYKSLTVLIMCHFIMDFYSTYGACK